jgi:iron(III) transport system substrate-binding protein
MLLAACTAPTSQTIEPTGTAPTNPGTLVIYSGRSEALVGPLIEQFKTATGVDVQVRYGSTAEIAATILEEDPGGLGAVAKAGLFAPLPDALVNKVEPHFRSPSKLWVGISGRARVIVYNTEAIKPADLPADIFELTDPKWAGRVGWAPTNGSFQAMVSAMRVVWGDAKTSEWLRGMQANQPVVFEGNVPIVEAVGAGEVDIGLTNHYYLYRFLREQGEGFGARNHFLSGGGPGSLILVAGAGRLAGGANEQNALRFLEFMLSLPAQQYFASSTSEYPLVEGVVTPVGLPPIADLEATALDIDMADLEDLQGTINLMREAGVLP